MRLSDKYTVRWQRAEGALVLIASLVAYFDSGGGWLMLAVLVLAFDISMIGYLRGPEVGAFIYNLGHNLGFPLVLLALSLVINNAFMVQLSYIWLAHIGLDRLFGYGLKTEQGFKHTHLGKINRN